jgi:hypothetical protein
MMGRIHRLMASEVRNLLGPGESTVAAAMANFGLVAGDTVIARPPEPGVGPGAQLLADALRAVIDAVKPRHWGVVVTNRRLLVLRLFPARYGLRDTGASLAEAAERTQLVVERAEWTWHGGRLYVRLGAHLYKFRFPLRRLSAKPVIEALGGSTTSSSQRP